MTEQRITDALKTYWEEQKGERKFPSEQEINAQDIEGIWEHCFLVRVDTNGAFAYEFLGQSIMEAYADDTVGEHIIEDQLYPESPGILNKFAEVVESGEPLFYEGVFINKNNVDIKFRKILLPLGDDGKVKHLIGGMRWKSMDLPNSAE